MMNAPIEAVALAPVPQPDLADSRGDRRELEDVIRFTIYCHTHAASQKRYVGLTKMSMGRRWNAHVHDAKRGIGPFHKAIRKYGRDAFAHEVLETTDTLAAANEAEQWWIGHFVSNDRRFGYNLDAGGRAHATHADTKRRLRESGTAAWAALTPEERHLRARCLELSPEARRAAAQKGAATFKAKTPEEKAAREAKRQAAVTPQRRRESAEKREAAKSPETRRAVAMLAVAGLPLAKRREVGRKGRSAQLAASTPEERSALAKLASSAVTPEGIAQRARKSSEAWAAKSPEERAQIIERRRAGRRAATANANTKEEGS